MLASILGYHLEITLFLFCKAFLYYSTNFDKVEVYIQHPFAFQGILYSLPNWYEVSKELLLNPNHSLKGMVLKGFCKHVDHFLPLTICRLLCYMLLYFEQETLVQVKLIQISVFIIMTRPKLVQCYFHQDQCLDSKSETKMHFSRLCQLIM